MKYSILESVLTLLSGDPTGPYIISADRQLKERKHTQRKPNSTVGIPRGYARLAGKKYGPRCGYLSMVSNGCGRFTVKKLATTDVEVTIHRMEDRQVY